MHCKNIDEYILRKNMEKLFLYVLL